MYRSSISCGSSCGTLSSAARTMMAARSSGRSYARSRLTSRLFFFSSRRRHTRCSRDWSSDVCSSDLFLQPGLRIKLHPDDTYAYGAHRGGIDERWFASTTEAANEGRVPDEGLSY